MRIIRIDSNVDQFESNSDGPFWFELGQGSSSRRALSHCLEISLLTFCCNKSTAVVVASSLVRSSRFVFSSVDRRQPSFVHTVTADLWNSVLWTVWYIITQQTFYLSITIDNHRLFLNVPGMSWLSLEHSTVDNNVRQVTCDVYQQV